MDLSKTPIEITCPKCKAKSKLPVLDASKTCECPKCGVKFVLDKDSKAGVKEMDRAMNDLQRTLKGLGKKR